MTVQDNSGKTRLPLLQRNCDECTKCCEGWLEGNVHGHQMFRGCKCHFLETSCQIYDQRPDEPCKNYNCVWLTDDKFPAWMKPNVSGIVVSKRKNVFPTTDGMKVLDYHEAIEAGGKIDASVLNWLIQWSTNNNVNLLYEVDGKIYAVGCEDIRKAVNR